MEHGEGLRSSPIPSGALERSFEAASVQSACGIASSDDYPGTLLASIFAARRGLPGLSVRANILCQHKFLGRLAQQAAAPEVTPEFWVCSGNGVPESLRYPLFAKPAKSFFSIGAGIVENEDDIRRRLECLGPQAFFELLDTFAADCFPGAPGSRALILESMMNGRHVTVDGFVFEGEVTVLGVVDSVMFPGTICFRRFEYPSSLDETYQQRITSALSRILPAVEFDMSCFNAEFIIDEASDSVGLIEINPRLSSQFADLYEKVSGINSYENLAALACGRRPPARSGEGRYRCAASCVLRTFEDAVLEKRPGDDDLEALGERHPGAIVELPVEEGKRLSSVMQDGLSYRYGIIQLGASDRSELDLRLEDCLQRLPFVLRPERKSRS